MSAVLGSRFLLRFFALFFFAGDFFFWIGSEMEENPRKMKSVSVPSARGARQATGGGRTVDRLDDGEAGWRGGPGRHLEMSLPLRHP